MSNNNKGFTLLELLVVVAILGLLATTIIAQLSHARALARDEKRIADIKAIGKALNLFYDDNGYYPDYNGNNGWASTCEAGAGPNGEWLALEADLSPYIQSLPLDPRQDDCDNLDDFPEHDTHGYFYHTTGVGDPPQEYDLVTRLETDHDQRCSNIPGGWTSHGGNGGSNIDGPGVGTSWCDGSVITPIKDYIFSDHP